MKIGNKTLSLHELGQRANQEDSIWPDISSKAPGRFPPGHDAPLYPIFISYVTVWADMNPERLLHKPYVKR